MFSIYLVYAPNARLMAAFNAIILTLFCLIVPLTFIDPLIIPPLNGKAPDMLTVLKLWVLNIAPVTTPVPVVSTTVVPLVAV